MAGRLLCRQRSGVAARWLKPPLRSIEWVLSAWLLMWPPLHMALSRGLGFSSWRFAGWGMYATPERGTSEVSVFLDGCIESERALPSVPDTPPHAGWAGLRLYLVRGGTARSLARPALPGEELAALQSMSSDLRIFMRPDQFKRLARWLEVKALPASARGHRMAVVVAHPRLDLEGQRAYAEGSGYLRGEDGWRRLEGRTGSDLIEEVLAAMGTCAGGAASPQQHR